MPATATAPPASRFFLHGKGALRVAVVVGVPLEALADALVAGAAVGALGNELVVARGGWRELEEVHHAHARCRVRAVLERRGVHGVTNGSASERQVLVEHNAEAILMPRWGIIVSVERVVRRVLLVDLLDRVEVAGLDHVRGGSRGGRTTRGSEGVVHVRQVPRVDGEKHVTS